MGYILVGVGIVYFLGVVLSALGNKKENIKYQQLGRYMIVGSLIAIVLLMLFAVWVLSIM